MRAVVDGAVVVDSRAPRMLFASQAMPQWWFPADDVVDEATKVRTGDDALLDGLVALPEDAEVTWWEDDQEVLGHPRDPYHRVDTRRTEERVVVRVGDTVVAETTHAVKLYETGLPVRYYVPEQDVADGVLGPSGLHTTCPYKGVASYRSASADGTTVGDAAFCYPEPLGETLQVRGMLCFLADGVTTTADGRTV